MSRISSSGRESHSTAPKVVLSCELCRQRKVKCDKNIPCATCTRAGVKCIAVYRQRLPRGRNGGRRKDEAELKARVGRLESLLRGLGGQVDEEADEEHGTEDLATGMGRLQTGEKFVSCKDFKLTGTKRYLGSAFWSALTSEVNGLRDVLEEESDEEVESPDMQSHSDSGRTPESKPVFDMVLLDPSTFDVRSDILEHPSQEMKSQLCEMYLYNVHQLLRALHAPSYGIGCRKKFGQSQESLRKRYRFAAEVALAKADISNSSNLTILQALLIYLESMDLTALAIRIARAMGLDREEGFASTNIFAREMRRRCWDCLMILDLQAAVDRGSEPLVPLGSYDTKAPLNVNDADLSPHSTRPVEPREGFTDMSFALMCRSGTWLTKRLNYLPRNDPLCSDNGWITRDSLVLQFQKELQEKYIRFCDPNNPFHWFVARIGELMCATARLLAVRPMQRQSGALPPPMSGASILQKCIEIMNIESQLNADFCAQWRGYTWLPWHAIAVGLAEVCVQPDSRLVDDAWEALNGGYERVAGLIADTNRGMLWRPIEKLMKRARQRRAEILEARGPGSGAASADPGRRSSKSCIRSSRSSGMVSRIRSRAS
ncbi:hypothetical protein MRB53_040099 [Persea americana]|nr:hypothetical protein MRB53_040099 [Persea americana]